MRRRKDRRSFIDGHGDPALEHFTLDIIFSVDLFNEGVDVPDIDTVLMLRPTDSPVLFLQQLRLGLRGGEGRDHLTVIDVIGNHRSFLTRPRTLLILANRDPLTTTAVIDAMRAGEFGLPEGCSVSYDIETVELIRGLTARELVVAGCSHS